MKERNETISIDQASRKTVTKNKIKEWHAKGSLPGVQTISVGSRFHRRFSEEEISLIQKIAEYQRQGYTLAAAVEKARKQLAEGGAL
jgi:hypothetical protein